MALILMVLAGEGTWADEDDCPPGCGVCALKERANALVPGVTWGADLRLRTEYLDNNRLDADGVGAEVWRQRYRARVWTTAALAENLMATGRLVTEPWYFSEPDDLEEQFTRNEGLIDQLYVDWKGALGRAVKVRAGRQDILLGEGWLVRRGTHLDSSRTNFFDAIRTTLALDERSSELDLIYLRNHSNSAWLARPFNDQDLDLSEQDETGVIVYGRYRGVKEAELDGYFIYKHDDKVLSNGNDGDIYTFGARAAGPLSSSWRYSAEVAPQFGRKNGTDLDALGFRGLLSRALEDAWDSSVRFGYEYRSGDREPDGAFDILWGRHGNNIANIFGPVASLEGQRAHLTDFHRLWLGWTGKPSEKVCLTADYGPMFRDANPFAGTPGFSEDGRLRGHLVTGSASYGINAHATTQVLCEVFFPGSYYEAPRDDTAAYLRWEMMLVW